MKVHERIDGRLRVFIEAQPMFFVATAPSGPGGHVNVSPKGMGGTFVVLGEHRVAYLDYHGSGAETTAHLDENGRITVMFCAFQGPPNIVRLYGQGRMIPVTAAEFPELLSLFPAPPDTHGVRSVIDVAVDRITDSCGYSVPLMSYEGDRDLLIRAHERRTDADLAEYRRVKNGVSIDGRPIFAEATDKSTPQRYADARPASPDL
ncbi:pyridoxamine 5'-phosphate oxidase family protein [Actinoplanes sp. NPDC026619]|uniref:pyridoxamine 5'-phosphate oxidase family protein n=1 Tax=Actinoplanes sp. NPDC026619 TaxID=3155798 RepID=UPI0033F25191